VLIRWLPTQVRVLAYFPNLVLLSAFLGIGVGCLVAARRSLLAAWPPLVLLLAAACWWLSGIAFTQASVSEHLWLLYYDQPNAPVVHDLRSPILGCFVLCAATFVPLGQALAARIAALGRVGRALDGYSLDLAGSLAGTIALAGLSFLGLRPWVWFAVLVAASAAVVLRRSRAELSLAALSWLGVLLVVVAADRAQVYSPYYALAVVPGTGKPGLTLLANGSLHQWPAELRRTAELKTHPEQRLREGHHLPYDRLRRPPRSVLVLGAGTGNDVAVALDRGAERVDAVEIDPAIVEIGREIHPARPYDDPRVRIFIEDARSYLNRTTERYDLIVFGTLDSMTRLSALSSVRLDNFVYTEQALRAARARLTDDGGVVMFFWVEAPYIRSRLVALHVAVFGEAPLELQGWYAMFNEALFSGPAFAHHRDPTQRQDVDAFLATVVRATDDWPFLYLRSRGIGGFYWTLGLGVVALTAIAVAAVSPELRRSLRAGRADWEMFCLGAAFLLLETKSVTDMNLAWGSTWLTNAVVFSSILLMLLASTRWMAWRPIPAPWSLGGTVGTLVVLYLLPPQVLLGFAVPTRLALSLLVVGSPIFFAAALFAVRFRERSGSSAALGWNLLGAVVGGVLEAASMAIGIRGLALVAMALYLLSALAHCAGRHAPLGAATAG